MMKVYIWHTEKIKGKNTRFERVENGVVVITAEDETEAWYNLMNTDIEAWTYLHELKCDNPRKKPEVLDRSGSGRSFDSSGGCFSIDLSSPKP